MRIEGLRGAERVPDMGEGMSEGRGACSRSKNTDERSAWCNRFQGCEDLRRSNPG
jgi:hypothetical protein